MAKKKKKPKLRISRSRTAEKIRTVEEEYPIDRETMRGIGQLWIQSEMLSDIAERYNMSVEAVSYHISHTILPAWRRESVNDVAISVMKVRQIARIAYERWFSDPKDAVAAQMLRWSVEREMKIFGHESPTRIEVDDQTTYRVAGKTKQALEDTMLQRLADKMEEVRGTVDAGRIQIEGPRNGRQPTRPSADAEGD